MSECCPPTDGSPWTTPTPGEIVVVPAGAQVIAVPTAGDCGCDPAYQGNGTVGGTPSTPGTVSGFVYPTVSAAFDAPAVGSVGQLYSTGAAGWAQPGALIWIGAYGAYLAIIGVNGDLVTYRNTNLTPGTTVAAGTALVPDAPVASSGSATSVTEMDFIAGTKDGANVLLGGDVNDLLIRKSVSGNNRWVRENMALLRLLSGQPTALEVKRDAVASTHATNKWANPVSSAITGAVPTGTISFPSFPALTPGQSIRALVQVKYKFAVKTASSFRLKVTINGVEWQAVENCAAVSDAATAANAANFTSAVNNKGPEGSAIMIIPLPADNAAVNVSVDARRALTTTSPLDADSHYVATFKVLGYFY
jgi:hypothetical protein